MSGTKRAPGMVHIGAWVPEEEAARLAEQARERQATKTDVIRYLLSRPLPKRWKP